MRNNDLCVVAVSCVLDVVHEVFHLLTAHLDVVLLAEVVNSVTNLSACLATLFGRQKNT